MSLYLRKRKRFLKKVIVGAVLFFLGALCFSLTRFLTALIFPAKEHLAAIFSLLFITILFVSIYKPIDKGIAQFFRSVLFKKKSYGHMTLMKLTEDLSTILDLKELSNLTVNTFGDILHLKSVALLLFESSDQTYRAVSGYGWPLSDIKKVSLKESSSMVTFMKQEGAHVLVRDRVVQSLSWQDASGLAHDFDLLRAGWVIPLFIKNKELIGLIAFASKNQDSVFDEADFHFFREFSDCIAKYFYNAQKVYQLQKALKELEIKRAYSVQDTNVTAIEQLATGIAHEIHNPLTIISGKAQVLLLQKDRAHMDEHVEEVLETIVKQTKRAADITRKLLMFSQSSGSLRENVDLGQVLQDTLALVSYQTSLDQVKIKRTISSELPLIYANVHEIREIFLNLILNAVQSVESGGNIHIHMYPNMENDCLEITVADSGQGISKDNLKKLFSPFFTTRNERVGLGLFITRQILHKYGGSIKVESREGKGSIFIVQLPYLTEEDRLSKEKEEDSRSSVKRKIHG